MNPIADMQGQLRDDLKRVGKQGPGTPKRIQNPQAHGIKTYPVERLPIHKVHPNTWNPNRLPKDLQDKLKRGVIDEELGILADILVRPCPRHKGRDYEIVDGEHRFLIYRQLGVSEIDAKVADLTDDAAKMAGSILNELRGQPDAARMARLMRDLQGTVGLDRMAELMPWTQDDLRAIAHLASDVRLEPLDLRKPPAMTFTLIAIPTPLFGKIAELVQKIALDPAAIVETVISDEEPK